MRRRRTGPAGSARPTFARPRSAAGARMLARRYYTSAEIFALETERIFLREWLYVGHSSRLGRPGDHLLARQSGESAIITRGDDGRLRALANVCRHRGARLCDSEDRFAGAIRCPYHAWTYELDGRLRAAPHMGEVEGFDPDEHALGRFPLHQEEGMVFLSFSDRPPPFAAGFGALSGRFDGWRLDELHSVHQTVYEVEANWKLLFQNYSECYHCPGVHPVLNRLTPYRDSYNDLAEGRVLGGPMKLAPPHESMTMTGRACASPFPGLSSTERCLVYYYTVFPNLFLSLHPDYVLVHRSEPLAADRTRIHCDWYFHPEAIADADFDASGAIEFWDMTNRQDWHLCTISQQGISSRSYVPGPYSELESQLAAFDRQYLEALGEGAGPAGERDPALSGGGA